MSRRDNIAAWLIGIGLVISVVHQPQQPFISMLFLPQIGNLLIIMASAMYLLGLKTKEITLGSKWLWIPLAVVAGSAVIRALYAQFTGDTMWGMNIEWSGAAYAMALFALYLASRKLGIAIFRPFTVSVILVAISCVVITTLMRTGIIDQYGAKSGSIISMTNYDMTAGFLIFGTLVSSLQRRWWLAIIALVGLVFTGAHEAAFVMAVLAVVLVVRRDWDRKLLYMASAGIVVALIAFGGGLIQQYYLNPIIERTTAAHNGYHTSETSASTLDYITFDRLHGWQPVFEEIKPLGYGYNINNFYYEIPHNVPLIIVYQLGILAALAWCFAVGYLVWKTKWKYAWIGFIAMGVFDHYIWTMAAPWFWALAGVSSTSVIDNDLIFRRQTK